MGKPKLAFSKLVQYLHKHKYMINSIYIDRKYVRFVECRTPKRQNTFLIHIAHNYKMKIKNKDATTTYKKTMMYFVDEDPPENVKKYVADVKGILESDLVMIGIEQIYLFKNSNKMITYNIGEEQNEEEEIKMTEELTEVDNIEAHAAKLLKKVDINFDPSKAIKPPKKEGFNLPNKKIIKDEEDEMLEKEDKLDEEEVLENENLENEVEEEEEVVEGIEIVDDKEEEELEIVKESNSDGKESEIVEKEETEPEAETSLDLKALTAPKVKKIKKRRLEFEEDEDVEDIKESDDEEVNEVEDELEKTPSNNEVMLGAVLISIELDALFKNIDVYEEELNTKQGTMDTNVHDIIKSHLQIIKDMSGRLMSTLEARIKQIRCEQDEIYNEIARLSLVLSQVDVMMKKILNDEKKYGDMLAETTRTYNQITKTIYEKNKRILQLRDETNELLLNYKMTLSDLIAL